MPAEHCRDDTTTDDDRKRYIGKERTPMAEYARSVEYLSVRRDRNVRTSGFRLNRVTVDVESLRLVKLPRRRQPTYRYSVES
ncbi:hypothetical protein DBV15_11443 [Temnothorax longispinosus]|uniref:Uncharacterized protein n=1 Tax=Temnothorax longispinosus TaxID=300112 RepID=A0A4V6RGL8_9HYME|nr:hypothetical protein DBV15_11443 [Temnothorax longispinosus]